MSRPSPPPADRVDRAVREALFEDLGEAGDVTSTSLVPAGLAGRATVRAEQPLITAGVPVALRVFSLIDARVRCRDAAEDGIPLPDGGVLLVVEGPARALLAGERTALNFLGRLCGIATATRRVVDAVGDAPTRIVDTRKTTPGMRALEKYAVRCGGGVNHRFGLYDMALIKENHIAMVGGVGEAIRRARAALGPGFPLQVEVTSPAELEAALAAGADRILLDNMDADALAAAVRRTAGRAELEASGGIRPEEAAGVARRTGVGRISLGALTRDAPWAELSMDLQRLSLEGDDAAG